MIDATVIDEPELEFGSAGRHIEQRAGVQHYGPADVGFEGRRSQIRVGIVGPAAESTELAAWLKAIGKNGSPSKYGEPTALFPDFPGCSESVGFLTTVATPKDARGSVTSRELDRISAAKTESGRILVAVEICATATRELVDRSSVDVVMVIRPDGVPTGVPAGSATGGDFHDLLKAELIATRQPIQVIRPSTWRGGRGTEDPATCAWNLFTALYYKAGGKPWRLARTRSDLTRCFVGVSFAKSDLGDHLLTSVAQVFNELGDGVIVRGGLARRTGADRQPHLSAEDARELLANALTRYRAEHRTLPAAVTVHKSSSFSEDEAAGFAQARDENGLSECELLWLTFADEAMLVRGSAYLPPLRGTLLTLNDDEHVLYTHGSIPYYQTYPGLYVPRPLGIRPAATERTIEEIASETLALTKLNWNRARLDGKRPITLLTSSRVGAILRHVPAGVTPAPRYANYM